MRQVQRQSTHKALRKVPPHSHVQAHGPSALESESMTDMTATERPLSGAFPSSSMYGGGEGKGSSPKGVIQRKPQSAAATSSPALQHQLTATQGKGQSLPAHLGVSLGQSMDADFGNVRIHADEQAAAMSNGIQARAFTFGDDIYFNRGEYNPSTPSGQHLLAHELAHVKQQSGVIQRQPVPATPAPMTRQQFEQVMQNTYGVFTIRTGTEAQQRASMGIPVNSPLVLPNWQSWDPGPASTVYQDIVDAFAEVNTTFNGFPTVNEITFYNTHYELQNGAYVAVGNVGAQFGLTDLTIYKYTTTARKGFPIARSNATGQYTNTPTIALGYGGDANAAPIAYPSQRQTVMRLIIHELGHGIAVAASQPNFLGHANAPDPNMMRDYMRAVGWANYNSLYDIGVPAVATAITANTTPPAQHRITAANWNDPVWVEQPVSEYMVSGGPGEDFAEAVTVYVENATLLQSRSPRRHDFLWNHQTLWQPRLAQQGSAIQRLMPRNVLPTSIPPINPLQAPAPSLAPNPSMIDWLPIRNEFNLRGAPWDTAMQESAQQAWMGSYNFYNRVLGLNPNDSAAWSNRTVPRLIGSGLARDYPTLIESSDRSYDTSSIIFPVSDIVQFLVNPR